MKLLHAAIVGAFCFIIHTSRAQTVTIEQTGESGWYSLVNYTDPMMGFTMYQELGQTFTASYPMHLQSLGFRTPYVEQAGNVILEIYSSDNMETFTTLLAASFPFPVSPNGPSFR